MTRNELVAINVLDGVADMRCVYSYHVYAYDNRRTCISLLRNSKDSRMGAGANKKQVKRKSATTRTACE